MMSMLSNIRASSPSPTLSPQKKQFLEKGNFKEYQLSIEQLKKRAEDYEKKWDIKILVSLAPYSASPDDMLTQALKILHETKKEVMGVLYTTCSRMGPTPHVETLLVTTDKVFNLIPYPECRYFSNPIHNSAKKQGLQYYTPYLGEDSRISPQASTRECGSLGLAYLKEYLKDNAKQFHTYVLKMVDPDQQNKRSQHHFLSSPHVLRYSQSARYNTLIYTTIREKKSVEVLTRTGQISTLNPLQLFLQENKTVSTMSNIFLSAPDLETFRQQWIEAYHQMDSKRKLMNTKNPEGSNMNRYLTYISWKNQQKLPSKETGCKAILEAALHQLVEGHFAPADLFSIILFGYSIPAIPTDIRSVINDLEIRELFAAAHRVKRQLSIIKELQHDKPAIKQHPLIHDISNILEEGVKELNKWSGYVPVIEATLCKLYKSIETVHTDFSNKQQLK